MEIVGPLHILIPKLDLTYLDVDLEPESSESPQKPLLDQDPDFRKSSICEKPVRAKGEFKRPFNL